jgi:hypothetical protein
LPADHIACKASREFSMVPAASTTDSAAISISPTPGPPCTITPRARPPITLTPSTCTPAAMRVEVSRSTNCPAGSRQWSTGL